MFIKARSAGGCFLIPVELDFEQAIRSPWKDIPSSHLGSRSSDFRNGEFFWTWKQKEQLAGENAIITKWPFCRSQYFNWRENSTKLYTQLAIIPWWWEELAEEAGRCSWQKGTFCFWWPFAILSCGILMGGTALGASHIFKVAFLLFIEWKFLRHHRIQQPWGINIDSEPELYTKIW